MQSDCACAVETGFSGLRKRGPNASKMTSKMSNFGTFLTIFGSFCEKSAEKRGSKNEPEKCCQKIHAGLYETSREGMTRHGKGGRGVPYRTKP